MELKRNSGGWGGGGGGWGGGAWKYMYIKGGGNGSEWLRRREVPPLEVSGSIRGGGI